MKLIKVYIVLLALGVSCTKRVEIPIPPNVPKNVVNVILSADSFLGGSMSETLSILGSDSIKPITNGSMLILDENNSQVAYQVNSPSGKYFSNNRVVPNKCYTVSFSSTLGNSEGKACVPSQAKYQVIDSFISDPLVNPVFNLAIGLADSADTKNLYRFTCLAYQIKSIKFNGLGGFDTSYAWTRIAFSTSSLSYFVNEYNYANNAYLLKDDKFNGDIAYLNFSVPLVGVKKLQFYIDAIDQNLFDYYRTFTAQQVNQIDPNARYINVYNNISNGYGIVGGENKSRITYIIN